MTNRWLGWAALMLFTGVATVFLRRYADPLIPQGELHGLLSGLFVVVVWPSLAWLLRSFARFGFWDLLSWFS
jgi:hypothetical protein